MKGLCVKLKDELKPGSCVLSNVFTMPGWRPTESSTDGFSEFLTTPSPKENATAQKTPNN